MSEAILTSAAATSAYAHNSSELPGPDRRLTVRASSVMLLILSGLCWAGMILGATSVLS
jgi:hypothetical protein